MGKDSTAPAAPDPTKTASTQAGFDQSTANYNAQLNRYNVNTPFGNQSWTQGAPVRTFNEDRYNSALDAAQKAAAAGPNSGHYATSWSGDNNVETWVPDPAAPAQTPDKNADQFYDMKPSTNWTQNIQLSPDAQTALQNSQKTQAGLSGLQGQALSGVAQTLASNPFDKSQLPAMQVNPGQTAQDALMSRLQPQIALQNQQFESDMANRGIAQGSDPYNQARRSIGQQQNDLELQAAAQGIGIGQQARQQAVQEQGYYANAPLNYLNGLMTGSQVQTPQFQSTPNVSANAPNYQQAAANQYQGQLNAYNAQTGSENSMTSGLMSLAAMALMFSDRRLKSNIERVGTHPYGIGIYEYDLNGQRQRGVMADEVERVKPEAVVTHPSGYKMVDYGKL